MIDRVFADAVWNRACVEEAGKDLKMGDLVLADMLYAHGYICNGGVDHALECLTAGEFSAALAGFEWFGLAEVASVLRLRAEQLAAGASSVDESADPDSDYTRLIPDDQVLIEAFETALQAHPGAFAQIVASSD